MRAMIVVAVLAVGCGPDFTGSFDGTLFTSESCSDGSGQAVTGTVSWDLLETNSGATLTLHGACDPVQATTAGNVATLLARDCPPRTTGNLTFTSRFTGGTLTLNEPNLSVDLRRSSAITDGVNTVTCSSGATGSLRRVR